MKQKLLQKTLLLLFALIAGSTSVWADDTESVTFSSVYSNSDKPTSYAGTNFSLAFAKGTGSNDPQYYDSGTGLRFYTGNTLTVSSTTKKIVSIAFTYKMNGSGSNPKVYPTGVSASTGTASIPVESSSTSGSWTAADDNTSSVVFTVNGSKGNIQIQSMTVTFVTSSGSDAATPTFSPVAGELTKAQNVTISSTGAAKIIYTTNGDDPTLDGLTTTTVNANSTTFFVTGDVTIKAKGVDSSSKLSGLASASYTVKPADPVILPAERTYATTTNVSFTQADDIDVYYTIDGTDPTSASTKYDGTPFAITENITVKAIAIDEYDNASDIVEAKFKNSDIQATEIVIDNWNTLFGTSFNGSVPAGDKKDYDGTIENVTVVYGEASNMYIKDAEIRVYNGSTLSFTAPAGYVITQIVFTGTSSSEKAPKANVGTFNYSTMKWTGVAGSVTLSRNSGDGYTKFVTATITLSNTVPVTITTADYATFCSAADLDFSTTGITVYKAKVESNKVKFTEVTDGLVPAYTGVLLYKDVDAETVVNVPVTTGVAALSENELVGVTAETAVAYNPDTDVFNYILQMDGANLVFRKATGAKLRANRAYLSTSYDVTASGARELEVSFGDETAINALENSNKVNDGAIYDLSGRRVENPTKGIYIMNGKKVVIK